MQVRVITGAAIVSIILLATAAPAVAEDARSCAGLPATISGEGTLRGTPERDVIVATGPAVISGLGADDVICGSSGADVIDAGAGDDTVYAGGGNDTVRGGPGDDQIYGDTGDDTIFGGLGDDRLVPGAGQGSLFPGAGSNFAPSIGSAASVSIAMSPRDAAALDAAGRQIGFAVPDGASRLGYVAWVTPAAARVDVSFADGSDWMHSPQVFVEPGTPDVIHPWSTFGCVDICSLTLFPEGPVVTSQSRQWLWSFENGTEDVAVMGVMLPVADAAKGEGLGFAVAWDIQPDTAREFEHLPSSVLMFTTTATAAGERITIPGDAVSISLVPNNTARFVWYPDEGFVRV